MTTTATTPDADTAALGAHTTVAPELDPDPSGQVLSVPRAAARVSDSARAELKAKTLRDKLSQTIKQAEATIQDDAKLAVLEARAGRPASARVLLRKRRSAQARLARADVALSTVMDVLDGMDAARDNAALLKAVEEGTAAIREASRDVRPDRVKAALQDSREAVAYVKEVGALFEGEPDMDDDEVAAELEKLEVEFGGGADMEKAKETVKAPMSKPMSEQLQEAEQTVEEEKMQKVENTEDVAKADMSGEQIVRAADVGVQNVDVQDEDETEAVAAAAAVEGIPDVPTEHPTEPPTEVEAKLDVASPEEGEGEGDEAKTSKGEGDKRMSMAA